MSDRHAWIYDRSIVQRGDAYNEPPRCRCGECGRVYHLPEMYFSFEIEMRRAGWKYTRETGWVCKRCKPLPRMKDGPNRVFEDEQTGGHRVSAVADATTTPAADATTLPTISEGDAS
jgi:hypothetical protein